MGTVLDKNIRAIYKKAMIDAEHSHLTNKNRRPRENTSEKREVSKD